MSREQRVTLLAMTLANSMILVDQTAVPLAIPTSSATCTPPTTSLSGS